MVASGQVVLTVEPVVVLHMLGAESSTAAVPETRPVLSEAAPQVLVLALALPVGLRSAPLHLAGGVWKSQILLFEPLWWRKDAGWVAQALA
jgi:hypothetical protein